MKPPAQLPGPLQHRQQLQDQRPQQLLDAPRLMSLVCCSTLTVARLLLLLVVAMLMV
jgi:hypothetical protein